MADESDRTSRLTNWDTLNLSMRVLDAVVVEVEQAMKRFLEDLKIDIQDEKYDETQIV